MRITAASLLFVSFCFAAHAQRPETKNIVIVTLDGMRWQEIFQGSDEDITFNPKYVSDKGEVERFWHSSEMERRRALMPFLWNVVATEGQLYGNRQFNNKVNCTNHHLISYPGYAEMLVGFRHKKVSSNREVDNPHATVLEAIESNYRFKDEVAAFATWAAFRFILRESKSDIYVNAGEDLAIGNVSENERALNELQMNGAPRSDSITFQYAMEYLKRIRPRVTFIGFDETDHYAHQGRYEEYLRAANNADQMIAQLWKWLQSQPDYKDQTTLLITTDHGRGNGKNNWRKHRLLARGSRQIWFAVVGPDTPSFGEMKVESKIYQKQAAKTIAAFLGLPYRNEEPVGEVVQTMIAIPQGDKRESSAFISR
jgi:hypothetical protein